MSLFRSWITGFALFIYFSMCKQRSFFLDHGRNKEGAELFRYFYQTPVEDGFYVDIGALDPIYHSSTLNLHVLGWKGVNVEAKPKLFERFLMNRENDININYAVGEINEIIKVEDEATENIVK